MDLGLKGKRAIVTGGSLGIGKAIARELAREGVNVAIVARSKDQLETTARELEAETRRRVIPLAADVTSKEQVDRMVAQAAALPDGRAVVTGGLPEFPGPRFFAPTGSTEMWDPATNSWNDVAPVGSARAFAGLVAVSGGVFQISGAAKDDRAVASVERFVWH